MTNVLGVKLRKVKFETWVILSIAILFLTLQGCASIINGKTQELTFSSVPDGATVSINGRIMGKTPLTITIDRKDGQTLTFEKEGFTIQTMQLTTSLEPWFWGNIVLGGVVGSTTDGISGAAVAYSPTQYNIALAPKNQAIAGLQSNPQNDAKNYIIMTYKNILQELNTKEGEYLTSLYTMLKIPKEVQTDAFKTIKEFSIKFAVIPEFADKVVNNDYAKK